VPTSCRDSKKRNTKHTEIPSILVLFSENKDLRGFPSHPQIGFTDQVIMEEIFGIPGPGYSSRLEHICPMRDLKGTPYVLLD
jgi:hypothetical protein